MRNIFTLLFAFVCVNVFASNWVSVGDGFYVDKASSKRNGDIAEIRIMHESNTIGSQDDMKFDCVQKKVLYWRWKEARVYSSETPFGRASAIACRRVWEVWK